MRRFPRHKTGPDTTRVHRENGFPEGLKRRFSISQCCRCAGLLIPRSQVRSLPGFGSVPQGGRLNEIRLVPTSANRQPALAAYSRGDDGKHRPYGLMVLQIDGDRIAGILGFPDPWLFEQCGLPPELT